MSRPALALAAVLCIGRVASEASGWGTKEGQKINMVDYGTKIIKEARDRDMRGVAETTIGLAKGIASQTFDDKIQFDRRKMEEGHSVWSPVMFAPSTIVGKVRGGTPYRPSMN
jgi:hypothetical protein